MIDFHGECDMVLLANQKIRIHIRTKINTWWSFIEAAALRIGSDVLEVSSANGGTYYWNGKPLDPVDGQVLELSGFSTKFRSRGDRDKGFRVDAGRRQAIGINIYKDFVSVDVNVESNALANFGGSVGMMGSFPDGQMLARNGTVMTDANAFGKEWQVLATEDMLFHSTKGTIQAPIECKLPEEVKRSKPRRLGESLIQRKDAEAACASGRRLDKAEMEACIYDILATNDLGMSNVYA